MGKTSQRAGQAGSVETPAPSARSGGAGRGNSAAQDSLRQFGASFPYSGTYGAPKKDALQVDAGQLTFDAEGTEGGRYHSRKAHVPPGPSGVTIGRGYDLGQHTAAAIRADLEAAGLSRADAGRFAGAAGLKGGEARAWLDAHRAELPEIGLAQQEALFERTYAEMSKDVQRISDKPGVKESYGEADLGTMQPALRDILVDLRYRGDYTGKAREKVQGAATSGALTEMTDVMRDKSAWKGVPGDRFARRAAYLQEAEEIAELSAFSPGGPMAPDLAAQFYRGEVDLSGGKAAPSPAKPAPASPQPAKKPSKKPAKPPSTTRAAGGAGGDQDDGWSDPTLLAHAEYLELELARIGKLPAEARRAAATEALHGVERFVAALNRHDGASVFEIAARPAAAHGVGAWVPPELIVPTRKLAALADGGGQEDWNGRLGAQQYRTQSDNLAAPEATCNVTSMAMVLERLGYSRADVVAAIDRELQKRGGAGAEARWGDAVLRYLDKQQAAGKAYQRLRGRDSNKSTRQTMAADYRTDAQMEDLVDFLLSLLGVDRTTITPAAARLLGKIETDAGDRPRVEVLRRDGKTSYTTLRERVHATLEAGGSAMMSVFHKGAGQSGTHLVVVQRVTAGGMVLDDPYGRIRADYDRTRKGDAFADAGKTRKTSKLRNVPTYRDDDGDKVDDDWRDRSASRLQADELRGASNDQPDAMLERAWNYVSLYRRGAAPPAS